MGASCGLSALVCPELFAACTCCSRRRMIITVASWGESFLAMLRPRWGSKKKKPHRTRDEVCNILQMDALKEKVYEGLGAWVED